MHVVPVRCVDRKNPEHKNEFAHPGDESYDSDEAKFTRETGKKTRKVVVGGRQEKGDGDADDDDDDKSYNDEDADDGDGDDL